jgi:peptidoglycan L-alanyl-D-glutamate endopeptidase CwlK
MYKFSESSLTKLRSCDHELQQVMELAIKRSPYDFGISEGVRTLERQKKLLADGKSTTLKSRHLANEYGLSEACDIKIYVDGLLTWDMKYYRKVAQAVFSAAIELGIQIEWGGLWGSFIDGVHFQLGSK